MPSIAYFVSGFLRHPARALIQCYTNFLRFPPSYFNVHIFNDVDCLGACSKKQKSPDFSGLFDWLSPVGFGCRFTGYYAASLHSKVLCSSVGYSPNDAPPAVTSDCMNIASFAGMVSSSKFP